MVPSKISVFSTGLQLQEATTLIQTPLSLATTRIHRNLPHLPLLSLRLQRLVTGAIGSRRFSALSKAVAKPSIALPSWSNIFALIPTLGLSSAKLLHAASHSYVVVI